MRAVVTGAAGFIGTHLCNHLLASGDEVLGIDALTDYYDPALKKRNLVSLQERDTFTFHRADLLQSSLQPLFSAADVVYHLAAQPGVRRSWGKEFTEYATHNVLATQAVLEAVRACAVPKLVFTSSSSVYGDVESYPTTETLRPRPVSPYGVTKLAAEHLCEAYRATFGLRTTSLRLFTVYGPRQRPDMAFSRLVSAAVHGRPFSLYGDGEQTRDFTYVSDVVRALRDAACSPFTGVANIGGGHRVSMKEVIAIVEQLTGSVKLLRRPGAPGDVRHTSAATTLARTAFGYTPTVDLHTGLAAMIEAERLAGNVPPAQ